MKPKLAAAVALAAFAVTLPAVLAVPRRSKAPVAVAERWPAPAPVRTATTEPEHLADPPAPTPAPEPPPPVKPQGGLRVSSISADSGGHPRQPAPRKCPLGLMDPMPYLLREGRCPPMPAGGTPLVLSFDGAPVEYLTDRAHAFDVNGSASLVTDWPTAKTPWLALDHDGDGRVADGSELFGSMTVLSSGERAPNGFAALRELDADGDGRITPADPGFAKLLVWTDRDGDRRSTSAELAPASTYELLSIDLHYTVDPRCDARGNCEVERASFRYRDAAGVERTGTVVDVHLAVQH